MMIYQKYQKPTKHFYLRTMVTRKIKIRKIRNSVRFNGGYYLNEDALNSSLLEDHYNNCIPLEKLATVWNPPIFKRQFCKKTERAIPYCQSSDVTNALEGSDVYINKIQATKVGSVVEENQILVTGFGTIGNTRLINELSAGISYANNACRIQVNDDGLYGYIYAVMSSKYGVSQLNKNASGSVVRYIEAPGIKKTLIPNIAKVKQEKINSLIIESTKLRVEANKLLSKSHKTIKECLCFSSVRVKDKVSIKTLVSSHLKRFEAEYFISEGKDIITHIKTGDYVVLKDVSKEIYRPGIFKRFYVDKGVEFFGGADIVKAIPKSYKKLSKAKTKHLESLKIKENQILITCGGTIGFSVLVNRFLSDKTASQHILRVEANKIKGGYLFAFLSSKLGLKAIQSFTYGSVIPQIEPHHLELLPIPILEDAIMNKVHDMIMLYKENISIAIEKELEAISLVEKEIEEWQK